jgi:hypothetical protein
MITQGIFREWVNLYLFVLDVFGVGFLIWYLMKWKFKTARSILLATALLIYIGGETINRGATANWWRIQHLEDDASFWQYISFVQDPWFFLGNGVITIGLLGIVYILIGTYWGNVAAVVALFLVVTVPTAVMWWIG